jgi:hypothetical protein
LISKCGRGIKEWGEISIWSYFLNGRERRRERDREREPVSRERERESWILRILGL